MKLTEINYEVPVAASSAQSWDVLARYCDVGEFISGVAASGPLNGSGNEACLGADRFCEIPDGKRMIHVSERIIHFEDGQSYTYEVHDWKNFPLAKMENTFSVRSDGPKRSVIMQRSRYRLRPGFLTGLAKGKLRKGMRETLLSYKHKIETGESNVDAKLLSKKHRNL